MIFIDVDLPGHLFIGSTCVICHLLQLVNKLSDRSCTRGMIHNIIHFISPCCPRASITLQCRIVAFSSNRVICYVPFLSPIELHVGCYKDDRGEIFRKTHKKYTARDLTIEACINYCKPVSHTSWLLLVCARCLERVQSYHSGSALDCSLTGRASNPSSGA